MMEIHSDDDDNYTMYGNDSLEWRGIADQFKAMALGWTEEVK